MPRHIGIYPRIRLVHIVGGCWYAASEACSSKHKPDANKDIQHPVIGFRVWLVNAEEKD